MMDDRSLANALRAGAWTLTERLHWLEGFGVRIDQHADDLIGLIQAETSKSAWDAFASEILPLRASIHWHLRYAKRVLATARVRGRPWWMIGQQHRVVRVPVGRVAIIATWNYPVQLLGIQLVQSVIAGNATVVKPSELSPRCQGLLLRLAADGMPAGMLTRTPATRVDGESLLASERFDRIVFTGSTEVGRVIAQTAARSLTPTTLELSGADCALVMAGSDLKLAAKSLWQAVTLNAGQTCMAPRRIIVEAAVYRAFLAYLAPMVAGAKPMRLISRAAAERMDFCLRQAIAAGGHSLTGVVELSSGSVVRPSVILDCPQQCELAVGNHFSPAVAVISAKDTIEALEIHRGYSKHLSMSIFASSRRVRRWSVDGEFIASLGAGCVTFNDSLIPTAHPGSSIGGRGESGWGVSRGEAGLLELTRAVSVSTTSMLMRIPTGEPDNKTQLILRTILGGFQRKPRT